MGLHHVDTKLNGYYTVQEAARALGVTERLVSRYINEERISAISLGKQWVIAKGALIEFASKPRRRGNPNFGKTTRK